MDFGTKLEKLLSVNLQQVKIDSLEETKDDYAAIQKNQLFGGLNRDDKDITPSYHPKTIQIKAAKGQPIDRVTLKDTGDFYDGIFVDVNRVSLIIDSIDIKSASLRAKYSERIFGLGPSHKVVYIRLLQPVFQKKVKDACAL